MTVQQQQQQTITEAAEIYRSRRDRGSNPAGSFDRSGRWYPDASEEQDCCRAIRGPSRAYPYSYLTHCRTADHVAHLTGYSAAEIRREARRLDNPQPREVRRDVAYKAVAVAEGGRLASIYDDATTYTVGRVLRQAARDDHGGGYYVYETIEAALRAEVPDSSVNLTLPRVVIECEAWGREIKYPSAKIANPTKISRTYLRPLRVVASVVNV